MTIESNLTDRADRGGGLSLVGYRATGKTTVGKLLAERLHRRFFDADREIEANAGRTIAAIFEGEGEKAFRDLEAKTLCELVQRHPGAILATGGGAVLHPANRRLLVEFGLVVWLRAEPDELARRLIAEPRAESRPPLTAAGTIGEIASMLAARHNHYRDVADFAVDTLDYTPGEIAGQILGFLDRSGWKA